MKKLIAVVSLFYMLLQSATAQELVGKITDGDSAHTPLYQAEVTLSQDSHDIATYKTYFDGTYRIKVKPNQTYQVKATYSGRKDTTVTISVDKRSTLNKGSLFITLHKDGLRLLGYIIDREQDIPIRDAGILLKNVMTRKEEKYFTDVNGYYNLRMDFETNYTFKLDKLSAGIINRYQDTSFNISTIGFNKPIDFRLDIKLGPARGYQAPRKGYDPKSKPDNKNLKPVVEVLGVKDSAKIREQAAALADLNRKLRIKDSLLASINKKLVEINKDGIEDLTLATKDEKTKALTEELKRKKAEDDEALKSKLAEDEKKKINQAKVEAELKAKQEAEKQLLAKLENENKEAIARKAEQGRLEKIKADKAIADKLAAEKTQKERELIQAKKEQEANIAVEKAEKDAAVKLQKLQEEQDKIARENQNKLAKEAQTKRAELDKITKEREEKEKLEKDKQAQLAAQKLKEQETILKAELAKKEQEKKDKELSDKLLNEKLIAESKARAEKAKQEKLQAAKDAAIKEKADEARREKEIAEYNRAKEEKEQAAQLQAELEANNRKSQLEQDLANMKKARELVEAKVKQERREQELRDKQAKLEGKKIAKELAEQTKERKRLEAENKIKQEEDQRIAQRKAQADAERRELEAKRSQEEQEKTQLVEQIDKLQNASQVRVTDSKRTEISTKDIQETIQNNTIAYWERKIKGESQQVVDLATAITKVVTAKGSVKNGQTEDPLNGVSINIRRLNSIVSQEVTSDELGAYEFQVDSGYFYLVSFFKDKYEISKQILDLTSYKRQEYTMLIQYLKEQDDFDPAAKMPVIPFDKNSAKLPAGLWSELEAIVKMMKEIPSLKIKLYGLGSLDEDYSMELSVSRARTVANLILETGIKASRVRINGVGAFRPRSGCVEGKACTPEQYKLDRVVMYKVIKE